MAETLKPLTPDLQRKKRKPRRSKNAKNAPDAVRQAFLQKTYLHLGLAIAALVAIEYVLFQTPLAAWYADFVRDARRGGTWLPLLLAFMMASRYARRSAKKVIPLAQQYAFLIAFVILKAIILLPLLWHAEKNAPGSILSAGILSLAMFLGLSLFAWRVKADYSKLQGVIHIGGAVLVGLIIARWVIGFKLGIVFSAFFMLYASIAVIYYTDTVLRSYQPKQYVVAALMLFASVTMLFASVLRLQRFR